MGTYCFQVTDDEKDNWDLCAEENNEKKMWLDGLSKALNKDVASSEPEPVVISII